MSIKSSDNQESNDLLAFKNSKIEIHFRFLCQTPAVEKLLIDSMSRAWTEISQFFYNQPITADLGNTYNDTLFPFTKKNKDRVTSLEIWEPEVYQSDFGICGSPNALGFSIEKPLKNKKIKTIYNEQFVYRVSFSASTMTEKHISLLLDVVKHVLTNSDIEGVSLASIEQYIVESDNISLPELSDYIPDNNEYQSAYPIKGTQRTPVVMLDANKLGWFHSDRRVASAMFEKWSMGTFDDIDINIITESEDDEIVVVSNLTLDVGSLSLTTTTVSGPEILEPTYIGLGEGFPLWHVDIIILDEVRQYKIKRMVQMPEDMTLEGIMNTAKSYPSSSFFNETLGFEYSKAIGFSKSTDLQRMIDIGLMLERGVDVEGNVFFQLVYDDHRNDEVVIFEGSETDLMAMFEAIVSLHSPIDLSDIIDISDGMGCNPNPVNEFSD